MIWPEILFCSSRKSDLEEFGVLWCFQCMKGVFKSIMSSVVLFHQFEGKIITALNEFLCRKLPKDSGPKWINFNIKWEIAAFHLPQQFFPSAFQFSLCVLCSFKCTDILSMKTSSSGYFESKFLWYSFEVTYLHISLFRALCSSQLLSTEQVGKMVFIPIRSINIAFIQLHCLLKHTFISMKPYNE